MAISRLSGPATHTARCSTDWRNWSGICTSTSTKKTMCCFPRRSASKPNWPPDGGRKGSPESTVHYYEILCREYNRRFGALNFPEITIQSVNLQRLIPLFERNDWDGVGDILLDALGRLKNAGAEFAAIL